MRAVEIITVYLACAAPVGVASFLRRSDGARRFRRFALSAAAGLLWPLALLSHFSTRERPARGITTMKKNLPPRESALERAERALLDALHRLEDEAREACGVKHSGPTAEAARSARATVERYTGLTLAARPARADGAPTESELEPARVSGRAGVDLEIAASLLARPSDYAASRRLFAALLPVYSRAVELLQQDGDARGVQTVARLFDDACSRLRRLEAFDRDAAHAAPEGDVQCTPHSLQAATPQLPSAHSHSSATTLTRA